MGALGDGSTEAGEEEEDALLQLPAVELSPEDAAPKKADHFFKIPQAEQDIKDKIDRSHPQVPGPAKV